MIRKYRKKPVIVEAVIFDGTNDIELEDFGATLFDFIPHESIGIGTLEDGKNSQVKHIASVGDYIIKGVNGEFYPCKPDIFEKTYELIKDFRDYLNVELRH